MIGWMNEIILKWNKQSRNEKKNAVHVIFISYLMNEKKSFIHIGKWKNEKKYFASNSNLISNENKVIFNMQY